MSNVKEQVEDKKQQQKTVIGNVISNLMDKTAVVTVERRVAHPVYRKVVKRTTKYYVHDADNQLKIGDTVRIKQTRPISKLKKWVLEEVIGSQVV